MADPTPTRTDTVEANIKAVEEQYGPLEYGRVWTQLLKDISISLAMLVDGSSD